MYKLLFFTVFLLILVSTTSTNYTVSYSTYPEIILHYKALVEFENFTVDYSSVVVNLNGCINGLLYAKYVFRENAVVISLKYINYSLNGFDDLLARQYIISKLNEKPIYVFSRNEHPYELDKPFIIEGGVKYYVSPANLELDGIVDQSASFILHNYTILREKRLFRYDLSTGILIELFINSQIYVNNTMYSNYTISFKQTYSSNNRLGINQLNKWTLFSLTAVAIFISTLTIRVLTKLEKVHQ